MNNDTSTKNNETKNITTRARRALSNRANSRASQVIIALILVLVLALPMSAEQHYKVPLQDPIYGRLNAAHNLGLITINWAQPYSYNQVREVIDYLLELPATPESEKARLRTHKNRLFPKWRKQQVEAEVPQGPPMPGLALDKHAQEVPVPAWWKWRGQIINTRYDYPWGPLSCEVDFQSRVDIASELFSKRTDFRSRVGVNFYGELGKNISYQFDFKGGLDKLEHPIITNFTENKIYEPGKKPLPSYDNAEYLSYAPFSYTKTWYALHNGGKDYFYPKSKSFSHYFPAGLSNAWQIESEIAGSAFGDALSWRFGRIRHAWGATREGIFLSPSARPFVAAEFHANLAPWITFSYLRGVPEAGFSYLDAVNSPYGLNQQFKEADGASKSYHYLVESQRQRLYATDLIQVRPFPWLTVALLQTMVYPKRVEFGYMLPLILPFLYQNNIGDFDNPMMGGFIELRPVKGLRAYFQFNGDEINPKTSLFRNARNTFAFQAGAEWTLPQLLGMTAKAQYTKIEPFTYTHYMQVAPWTQGTSAVVKERVTDVSFTNDGEGIGSYLSPNSDEWLLKVSDINIDKLTLGGSYQLIRHGWLGPYNKDLNGNKRNYEGFSGGEYTDPLDFSNGAYQNRPKHFLHDGLYRWYHTIGIEGRYDFDFPVTLGLKLSYTRSYLTDTPYKGGYVDIGAPYQKRKGSGRNQFNILFSVNYGL